MSGLCHLEIPFDWFDLVVKVDMRTESGVLIQRFDWEDGRYKLAEYSVGTFT